MLSFERYSLKFLDNMLQEGPQDSSSVTTPICVPILHHITVHMTKPPPVLHTVKLDGRNKAKTTTHHISM